MAFLRMMGAESVAYHEATVLGRGDDHPGAALDYYGNRGETPLRWGGRGARLLGLSGPVESRDYKAIFGPGGAADPDTRVRLANTKRPGMELVVSAHKSVAELGVIGRADDMHTILDAERDATLEYLDWLNIAAALESKESALGRPLTSGQRVAVATICSSVRGIDVIVGLAGSGKTTALDAVCVAFQSAGYRVVGTATSGQASQTLGAEAQMASSTVASLLWRLDHGRALLDESTVVILDEAGMTDDHDLLRLVTAADMARAKIVRATTASSALSVRVGDWKGSPTASSTSSTRTSTSVIRARSTRSTPSVERTGSAPSGSPVPSSTHPAAAAIEAATES